MGLNGLNKYKAGVALNRKILFPLFNTIKVWKKNKIEEKLLLAYNHVLFRLLGQFWC